jgi:hypothetical protein
MGTARRTTRHTDGMPHIEIAERALWWASILAATFNSSGQRYHLNRWHEWCTEASRHIEAASGPRSVRVRARRLQRQVRRLAAQAAAAGPRTSIWGQVSSHRVRFKPAPAAT